MANVFADYTEIKDTGCFGNDLAARSVGAPELGGVLKNELEMLINKRKKEEEEEKECARLEEKRKAEEKERARVEAEKKRKAKEEAEALRQEEEEVPRKLEEVYAWPETDPRKGCEKHYDEAQAEKAAQAI